VTPHAAATVLRDIGQRRGLAWTCRAVSDAGGGDLSLDPDEQLVGQAFEAIGYVGVFAALGTLAADQHYARLRRSAPVDPLPWSTT